MLAAVPRRTNALGTETYNAHDVHALLCVQLEKGTADLCDWEETLIAQSEARKRAIALAKKVLEEEQGQLDELTAALQKIWDLQLGDIRMRHLETEPEVVAPPTPDDAHMRNELVDLSSPPPDWFSQTLVQDSPDLSICDETSEN